MRIDEGLIQFFFLLYSGLWVVTGFGVSVGKISQSYQIYMDNSTGFGIIAVVQKHRIIQLYVLNHDLYSIEIKSYISWHSIKYNIHKHTHSFLNNVNPKSNTHKVYEIIEFWRFININSVQNHFENIYSLRCS